MFCYLKHFFLSTKFFLIKDLIGFIEWFINQAASHLLNRKVFSHQASTSTLILLQLLFLFNLCPICALKIICRLYLASQTAYNKVWGFSPLPHSSPPFPNHYLWIIHAFPTSSRISNSKHWWWFLFAFFFTAKILN